jgi:hypothetical protein
VNARAERLSLRRGRKTHECGGAARHPRETIRNRSSNSKRSSQSARPIRVLRGTSAIQLVSHRRSPIADIVEGDNHAKPNRFSFLDLAGGMSCQQEHPDAHRARLTLFGVKEGYPTKLAVSLAGGGACWTGKNCAFLGRPFSRLFAGLEQDPSNLGGRVRRHCDSVWSPRFETARTSYASQIIASSKRRETRALCGWRRARINHRGSDLIG